MDGKSYPEAADILLDFVQSAFVYEYDDKVWGDDRAFFAEESLFYPYCDCEDRSILFSRLVRNLLGLDVILVYYPSHFATAVKFEEPVKGDYILKEGFYGVLEMKYTNDLLVVEGDFIDYSAEESEEFDIEEYEDLTFGEDVWIEEEFFDE